MVRRSLRKYLVWTAAGAAAAGLLLLVGACSEEKAPAAPTSAPAATAKPASTTAPAATATTAPTATRAPAATSAPAATAPATTAPAAPAATTVPLKPLKVEPVQGYVGAKFTIVAEGLPASKEVDFQWVGWEANYVTKVIPDNVEYVERLYSQKRAPLGKAVADSQGRVTVSVAAPEDHGEAHDIFATVDGKDVAKGGFRIMRSVEISSTKGAVGDPITLTVKGMATSYYQSTMSVQWDNNYTGFISTVTTKGTGVAHIRAAGPPGNHIVQVVSASQGMPYLNSHDNARNWHIFSHLPERFTYTVTEDRGLVPPVIQWPRDSLVAKIGPTSPRTTGGAIQSPLAAATLQPGNGYVNSTATVRSESLPPNTDVDLLWVTARGNRTSGSGWALELLPLGKSKTSATGALAAPVTIPDDLGGWHTVRIMSGEKVLSEVPYYVERSLVSGMKTKYKAGEIIEFSLKGVGWTELDNGVALTYDNSYIGYGCGFSSNGTINFKVAATGAKGTHLIDMYPMIYEGHANKQVFNFQVPQLTALEDNPGLALGYRFPIIRLSIEIE